MRERQQTKWKFRVGSLIKHSHADVYYLILGQGAHTHCDYYYVWMFGPQEVVADHVDHDESCTTYRSQYYVDNHFIPVKAL